MEVSGQFHAPAALPPGKDPQVPIRYPAEYLKVYFSAISILHWCLIKSPSLATVSVHWIQEILKLIMGKDHNAEPIHFEIETLCSESPFDT
jgi:hypothetical protein